MEQKIKQDEIFIGKNIRRIRKEKDPVDWKDHLIDPETFGADRAGEKDPVEKAEDAGEETGGCEKNCSGDEWMGLMGRRHGSSEMAEGFGYIYVGAGE